MISKLVFLAVLGLVYSKTQILRINEKRATLFEVIEEDEEANTVTYYVPSHNNREASILKEFKDQKMFALKQFAQGKNDVNYCRYGPLEDEQTVKEVEKAIEKTGGNMVKNERIETEEDLILVTEVNVEAPAYIRKFCNDDKRKFVIIPKGHKARGSMKDIEKRALEFGLEAKSDHRKRAVVREFIACTNASTMKIMTCPGSKLRAQCKIRRPSCTYKISCPMDANKGGFNCAGLHKLNSIVCCDYDC